MKNYRKLNIAEINQLTTQFCTAEDWSKINVVEGFSPDHITHTRFSGEIELGIFEKEMELPGGLKKKTGLHHVTLHNCSIGNNSLIENIPNYIANYRIGSDCFIQNVNLILTEGESCFGNNTEVSVLNETGGREVPIYRQAAQTHFAQPARTCNPVFLEIQHIPVRPAAHDVEHRTVSPPNRPLPRWNAPHTA